MTGPRAYFKRKTYKKNKGKTPAENQPPLFDPAVLIASEGRKYCQNYDALSPTCVQCAENREGPYRAGCFKRGANL